MGEEPSQYPGDRTDRRRQELPGLCTGTESLSGWPLRPLPESAEAASGDRGVQTRWPLQQDHYTGNQMRGVDPGRHAHLSPDAGGTAGTAGDRRGAL